MTESQHHICRVDGSKGIIRNGFRKAILGAGRVGSPPWPAKVPTGVGSADGSPCSVGKAGCRPAAAPCPNPGQQLPLCPFACRMAGEASPTATSERPDIPLDVLWQGWGLGVVLLLCKQHSRRLHLCIDSDRRAGLSVTLRLRGAGDVRRFTGDC